MRGERHGGPAPSGAVRRAGGRRAVAWASLLVLCLLSLAASCRRSQSRPADGEQTAAAPAPTPAPSSPAPAPAEPQARGARLELGYESDAAGSIPHGLESRQFAAASRFVLAVRTDDISAGTPVAIEWRDAAGAVLARDTREVATACRSIAFTAPDTASWPGGAYRVAVEIDGRPAGELEFRIEAAAGAGS